jgi:hypothetical protein
MLQTSAALQSIPERVGARPAISSVPNQSSKSVVSLCESSEGHFDVRDRTNRAGILSAKTTRTIPAFEITQGDWLKKVSAAMHAEAGDRPGKAKYIAGKVGCSPKTAQAWLDAEATPAGILCNRAMAALPAYAALKRQIAGMDADLDPRVQQKIQELHRMMMDLADGKAMHT